MKVIKFGGTSLADANQIKKVKDIILADENRRIVVVSAPGKRFSADTKVTDMLIALANAVLEGGDASFHINNVVDRYASIAKDLELGNEIVETIREDITKRANSNHTNKNKFIDLLKAAGEDNSAKLVAAYLVSIGVDAEYINPKDAGLVLSDEFGNAQVLQKSYFKLARLGKRRSIMIFPGFFGYSETGEVVTFSRGGSDITGAILAAAVNADVYENFTDVDSVYAANPKIIKNPVAIPLFTYEEMRELAYAGFSVFHEEALAPVYQKGITVNIRNTNNPDAPGTLIVPESALTLDHNRMKVVGIAAETGFLTLHVEKYMMNREIGFGRKLLQIIEEENIPYEHTPSGIDSISIILQDKYYDDDIFDRIIKRIYAELEADDVTLEFDQAIVMIVGKGMASAIGTLAKATAALTDAKININMINQGSSEVSIMFGIDKQDSDAAVKALYNAFFN